MEAPPQVEADSKKKGKKKKEVQKPPKGKKGKKKKELEPEIEEPELPPPEEPPVPEVVGLSKENWDPYLQYIDRLISDNLVRAANISLKFFVSEMDPQLHLAPLFELLLELHEPHIVFVPTLDIEEQGNFFRFVLSLTEDITKMGEVMPRVLKNFTVENYYTDICEDMDTLDLISTTLNRMNEAIDLAYEYIKKFEEFSYLWLENRQEFLRQFLLYGRTLSPDELELLKDESGPGIKETPPTIKQFKEQIDFYEGLYKKLESFDMEKIIKYWMRIDVRPLRQAVLNTVCKWGNLFKQHLVERVTNSIEELESFIIEATAAMQVELTEDDYDGLLKVMGYLMKVKDRQDTTDLMFEPLKEIIDLLRNYGVEFPEEIHVQLQELPDKWNNCKKVRVIVIVWTKFQ